VRRLALVPTLIAAILLPSGAQALGLGKIEIQSALNQRLDAEIPLRAVPSGQADEITVSLASEEAFENVGLDRPFALTRLRFTVKERGAGGYYVHVTSQNSIVEPFLSFLVEVDWPGGNLLREYTVLLDPPVFASEDDGAGSGSTDRARTTDSADDAGVTGEIERDAESSRAETGTDDDASTAGADAGTRSASGAGQDATGQGDDQPVFLEVEEREDRAERARAEAQRAEAERDAGSGGRSAATTGRYGPVGDGETLWSIASRLRSGDMTVQQMMIALLRYNPEAFAGENVNRLKKGYVLRVPDADRVVEVSAQRALAEVREQNGAWRELQEGVRTETSVAASEQGSGDSGTSGAATAGSDTDAELSIVGADEGGASSDEAASATGSSGADESRKLQLAREELESTRIEKEELASRVEELEQTVSKMERLLEVRDERLSALQQELRELEGREAGSGASGDETASDETETDVAAAEDADGEMTGDGEAAGDQATTASAAEAEDAETEADADNAGEETVAAAEGDTGDGEEAAAGGTDGGSDGDGTTVAEDDATTTETTASADTTEAGAESGQADGTGEAEETASATGTGQESYVPEDKQATESDRGFETTRTQEPEETWLDKVNGVIATVAGVFAGLGGGMLGGPVGLGLAAAVVLLGGGLILMRRRREAAESADLDDFDPIESDADIAPFDADSSGRFEAQDVDGEADADAETTRAASAEDAQSALMAEEFDVASLDEDETSAPEPAAGPVDESAPGLDEDEGEKDDTVAEADVYLAYGLHQQAEDLLRLALREQSGNAMYHEKLLETLYASGKTDEFVEEAQTFRGLVDGPESRLWQRVLAMGRDIAPRHELFAEGETAYTAADVQPARPEGTDLELDDAEGDIDFGLDDDAGAGGDGDSASGDDGDEDFSSTMMLDSGDFEAVEGDGGLVGPEDDRPAVADAGATGSGDSGDSGEDEDLEFDLGDLDSFGGDAGESATAAPAANTGDDEVDEIDFDLGDDDAGAVADAGEPASGESDGDGALDFDLDFEEPDQPEEGLPTEAADDTSTEEPESGTAAYDGGLDFDFDLDDSAADSTPETAADESEGAEPPAVGDDDTLEIGDLEIGDLDSLETESEPAADPGDAGAEGEPEAATAAAPDDGAADEFDLSELEAGLDEAPGETETARGTEAGSSETADAADAFDLSDLDQGGTADADDDDGFNLDDFAADEPESATTVAGPESAPSGEPDDSLSVETGDTGAADAPSSGTDSEGTSEDDEEFDTMLDLARAYIDMGDPESATNALEEVASSGNERQRGEAQSLLESVR
jgi:pilus assembly protein FimV